MAGKDKGKCKGKITLEQATKAKMGSRLNSTLSLTSALDETSVQRHAPAALPQGKTPQTLYRRLCGPQGWSGRVRKISPLPGFDPHTVQLVASPYTHYAIPAHSLWGGGGLLKVCFGH